MARLQPIIKVSYWTLASLGGLWAFFLACLTNPTIQRHALYSHKLHTGSWHNVSNPESFGFAKGQVTPFHLDTTDGEKLFCWHVIPLDVYLANENELVQKATEIVDDLKETVGYKLMKNDPKSKIVVNFHGNVGHVAQGYRPSTYRSISGIPHTHLLTCDYRGFGYSTLKNAPHIPTENGLITDGISIVSYILNTLQHPASRTVLLGQSLGTAVTAATALYFTDESSTDLPSDIVPLTAASNTAESFAGIILVAPFPNLPVLLRSYKIAGIIPVLSPLRPYPRIANYLSTRIVDHWPTLPRLRSLLAASKKSKTPVHVTILHARNDQEIDFRLSEDLYSELETSLLGEDNVMSTEERRSIHGGERVKRGAFAYRNVEDGDGERSVELEIVRYGGHNEVVGFAQVSLAIRRAWKGKKSLRPGLDVE